MLRNRYAIAIVVGLLAVAAFALWATGSWIFSNNEEAAAAPVAQVEAEPELGRPANELKKGVDCTLEEAEKLNPSEFAKVKAEVDADKAGKAELIATKEAAVRGAFAFGTSLPKLPSKIKKKLLLPAAEFVLDVSNKSMEPYGNWLKREADKLDYVTCSVHVRERRTRDHKIEFSGDPKELAGLLMKGLETTTELETSYQQFAYYSNYQMLGDGFTPFGFFLAEEYEFDLVTEALKKLVANPSVLLKVGPWVRTAIKLLSDPQKQELAKRLEHHFTATQFNFDDFAEKADEDADFIQASGQKMHGMMYRRALASRIDEDLMRIYRAWLIMFAHDIENVGLVNMWAHVVQDDMKALKRHRHKYRLMISRLRLPREEDGE